MEKKMAKIKDERLPPNITKTISRVYEHFCKFLETKDIDKNTAETMLMIFKSNTDDAEQFEIESSESDGECSPGR